MGDHARTTGRGSTSNAHCLVLSVWYYTGTTVVLSVWYYTGTKLVLSVWYYTGTPFDHLDRYTLSLNGVDLTLVDVLGSVDYGVRVVVVRAVKRSTIVVPDTDHYFSTIVVPDTEHCF